MTLPVWHLHRDSFYPAGVWGQLEGGGGIVLQTIENADTLVPPGEYECRRSHYYRGGYPTFEVMVPDRERILIHAANLGAELLGCIAPGEERGFSSEHIPAVWRSRVAHSRYMAALDGCDLHLLVITEEER